MNKLFKKIESVDTSKAKATTGSLISIIIDFVKVFLIICLLTIVGDWTNCFNSFFTANVTTTLATAYFLYLIVNKQILLHLHSNKQPKNNYSITLYDRLIIIYIALSTIIVTIVSVFVSDMKWYIVALIYALLSVVIEFTYQYWGMIKYNTLAFIISLLIVSTVNAIFVILLTPAVIAMVAAVIFFKIFSIFMPNMIIFHSNGTTSYGYFFK